MNRIDTSSLVRPMLLVLAVISAGCYRYEPVESPRPGMDVRARLHTEAAVRHSAGLDEPVMFVDGRVVEANGDTITFDVLVARDPSVFSNVEIRQTVQLGRNEIQALTERRISTSRSILFAGAIGAGSYLMIRGITAVIGGNEGEDDPGPQFDRRPAAGGAHLIPLLRVPLPGR